jgi:hypothetical protein
MDRDARASQERQFWDRYAKTAIIQGIKSNFVHWHVIRAQAFIKAFPGKRLAVLGPDDITGYLQEVGSDDKLQSWQFRQVVDAIRILYGIVRTDWAPDFDWDYWLNSALHRSDIACRRRRRGCTRRVLCVGAGGHAILGSHHERERVGTRGQRHRCARHAGSQWCAIER